MWPKGPLFSTTQGKLIYSVFKITRTSNKPSQVTVSCLGDGQACLD